MHVVDLTKSHVKTPAYLEDKNNFTMLLILALVMVHLYWKLLNYLKRYPA